jgi:hypothetical protein
MGGIKRTTRICSVSQLNPKLLKAFGDYFREHNLGDPAREAVVCSETVTDRQGLSRLAAWLEGSPDPIDYLGLILTEGSLLWSRSGERLGTVIMWTQLKQISVRPYTKWFSKEFGMELCGWIGDEKKKKNASGRLALGPQDDARKFVDEVVRAVADANPPPKKREIPWLRWLSRRKDE